MSQPTFSAPPYIDRRLDFWKSCLLFVLFAILLLGALFGRQLPTSTRLVLVETPRALPTLRPDILVTLAPTQTPIPFDEPPLVRLGEANAAQAEAVTATAIVATNAFETATTSAASAQIDETATPTAMNSAEVAGVAPVSATATFFPTATFLPTSTLTPTSIPPTPIAPTPIAPTPIAPTSTAITHSTIPFAMPTATEAVIAALPLIETPAAWSGESMLEASLIPLTLSYPPPNAALPALVVSYLEGTGAPGTLITVNYIICTTCTGTTTDHGGPQKDAQLPMQTMGSALVDGRGRWLLSLPEPLWPGQYQLLISQTRADGVEIATLGSSFTVLEDTLGPLALSIPMITFPTPAALIDLTQLEDQQLVLHGSALPGQRIQLYINGTFAGEAFTDMAESWHIPVQQVLSPGSYIAHVFALDPSGNIVAESAPAAFVIMRQHRG